MSRDYQKIRYNCSLDRPPCLLDPGSITRAPRAHIHLHLAGSNLPRFALADLEIITQPSGGSRDSSTGRLIRYDHMCYWAAWTRELKPRTLTRLVPNLSGSIPPQVEGTPPEIHQDTCVGGFFVIPDIPVTPLYCLSHCAVHAAINLPSIPCLWIV